MEQKLHVYVTIEFFYSELTRFVPYPATRIVSATTAVFVISTNVLANFMLFNSPREKKMEYLSRGELRRFVVYANRTKLTPMILFGTRQTKSRLIQAIDRYWQAKHFHDFVILRPRINAPHFRFHFDGRRWDFEIRHELSPSIPGLDM